MYGVVNQLYIKNLVIKNRFDRTGPLVGLRLDKFIPSNDIFTSDSQLSTQRISDIIQEKWFDLQ